MMASRVLAGVADLHALQRRCARAPALAGCRRISGLAGRRREGAADSKIKGSAAPPDRR